MKRLYITSTICITTDGNWSYSSNGNLIVTGKVYESLNQWRLGEDSIFGVKKQVEIPKETVVIWINE